MRRIFIIILSLTVLMCAVASEAGRTTKKSRGKARTTKVTKKKSTKRSAAPVITVNIDSINEARRAQEIRDSLNALNAGVADGDVNAINELAQWYYQGHNVPQDYTHAAQLWAKAAESASPQALANLGLCYRTGQGVPCDSVEAARLFMQAMKQGNGTLFKQMLDSSSVNAFDALVVATCYERGEVVKRDLTRAAELYSRASALGSNYATVNAGLCYLNSGDTVKAMEYLPKGAKLGDTACQYWTGLLRLGTPDGKESVAYILKAAETGMPEAENEAGLLYSEGKYVQADPAKAVDWLRKSAMHGYPEGMYNYAEALKSATNPDYAHALYWLAQASDSGYEYDKEKAIGDIGTPFGEYVLGMKAYIVDKDYATADRLFKQSDKLSKAGCGNLMQAVMLTDPANPKSNPKKGAKELEKLATSHPEASYWLAQLYTNGIGVAPNKELAERYMKKAESLGYIPDTALYTEFLKSL